jgi:hypothetical protein
MRPLLPVLLFSLVLPAAPPCTAQSLSSRPAIFSDPALTTDPSYGELVLGQTTLTSALRMFAVELQDSVWVPLGHGSNPDTLRPSAELPGDATLRAHYRLELGAGRYTLYFDRHERLVAAITSRSRLPRPIRREELVSRYPTLRVEHVGRTAEGAWVRDDLIAPLTPCVSLVADVWRRDKGMVDAFGYVHTCATKPASQKATLDREP